MTHLSNSMMSSKDKQQTEEIVIEKNIVIDSSPEVILNKKVSYTWRQTNTPDFPNTVVTWELEEIAANKTRVKLLHTGFESSELFRQHDEGWSYLLDRLQ